MTTMSTEDTTAGGDTPAQAPAPEKAADAPAPGGDTPDKKAPREPLMIPKSRYDEALKSARTETQELADEIVDELLGDEAAELVPAALPPRERVALARKLAKRLGDGGKRGDPAAARTDNTERDPEPTPADGAKMSPTDMIALGLRKKGD